MSSLKLALLLETDETFVSLEPGVLKTLLAKYLKEGLGAEEVYDKLVKDLIQLTTDK